MGNASFTLSTLGHGPVISPDMSIVLWLDGTTVLDRQLPSPASSLVGAFDARFELAGTRDVEGHTALVGKMEDCRMLSLQLSIRGQTPVEAQFDTCGWM